MMMSGLVGAVLPVVSALGAERLGRVDRWAAWGGLAFVVIAHALIFGLLRPRGQAGRGGMLDAGYAVAAAQLSVVAAMGVVLGSELPWWGLVSMWPSVSLPTTAFGLRAGAGVLASGLSTVLPAIVGSHRLNLVGAVGTCIGVWTFGAMAAVADRLGERVLREHAARDGLVDRAIVDERERIGRDLHDLLSLSLSAIVLKAEVMRQPGDDAAPSVRREADEILALSRQTLGDVRRIASGYMGLSLHREAQWIRGLLADAGIDADLRLSLPGTLDAAAESALSAVLREAATNVLSHSRARSCWMEISAGADRVTLIFCNDGAPPGLEPDRMRCGGGLAGMQSRLERLGGAAHSLRLPQEVFCVVASVPLTR
jgi:two-component system sensor histidine kinase DesK